MSTTPGESTWADAGLIPPEDEAEVPESRRAAVPVEPEHQPEHQPAAPRPDLRDEAAEPDVVEQALGLGEDEDEGSPEE